LKALAAGFVANCANDNHSAFVSHSVCSGHPSKDRSPPNFSFASHFGSHPESAESGRQMIALNYRIGSTIAVGAISKLRP
jgi:hypothetical protein